ncbi:MULTISPECIES: MauE/DoxX family redox-associated membrane protein [Actinosynnema]|uniref:TlpA family protein disulfide reductase n=1 Tax=Actinosynnema TaxID=40566 RepID=UPI0020A252EB|nr:MauE/DoxX family redox-associated membrane protein [Actinosynnema pretiosum]MCP2098964.1 Methylamine utilization protein MauE [Actinosynnema pretiosum]
MVELICRAVLVGVFLAALLGKARGRREIREFRESLSPLVPRWAPVGVVVGALLVGEALVVVLLGLPGTKVGFLVAAALLLVFCAGIGVALLGGRGVSCRCFGSDGGPLGARHLARNGALIAVACCGYLAPSVSLGETLTPLTIVVALLVVVVGAHLLFTVGLVARIKELQAGAAPRHSNLPAPGTVVQGFSAVDTDGEALTREDLGEPTGIGFFSVGCGPCRVLSDALVAEPPPGRFVSFVDVDPAEPDATARLVAKVGQFGRVVLIGADDPLLTAFGVLAFPTLLHVHGGVVTASGTKLGDGVLAVPAPAR